MDKLEATLTFSPEDFNNYKKIKSFLLNRYKNYKRQISFNSDSGMIAYADSLLNYYSTKLFTNNSEFSKNLAQRNINSLSFYTSKDSDKAILAELIINTISNFEAVVVNGLLKLAIYTLMYTSSESTFFLNCNLSMSTIIGTYVDQENNFDNFNLIFQEAKNLISEGASDILFSTLLSIFSFVRKSLVLVTRTYGTDKALNLVSTKANIGEFQNLINALLDISLSDFYDTAKYIINNMTFDVNSEYYSDFLNQNIINKITLNFPSLFANNRYSIEDSSDKIIISYSQELIDIQYAIIIDTSDFSDFLDTIDDSQFLLPKELLALELSNFLRDNYGL